VFFLFLPYTFLLVPNTGPGIGRWDHAWPMALMVWAVLAYRRPSIAGALLGLAAGSVVFPVVTFPIWLSFYRGRGAGLNAITGVDSPRWLSVNYNKRSMAIELHDPESRERQAYGRQTALTKPKGRLVNRSKPS